ncbi:MAG: ABC transporter ATP-binding protein/permease [Roseburia sp.]|nr:ABC transporter ATP-binding protein/permease [Roseburia sp.]
MLLHRKKKEPGDNPLHTEYGIVSNSIYILKKVGQYCPPLLFIMGVGIAANSITRYLWSFIGKFVIDIVQIQAGTAQKDIRPLLRLVLLAALIELVCTLLGTITNNKLWYRMIYVRMCIITERVAKSLRMDYQMLEQPKILDMHEKATRATGGNNNGVEGLMHSVCDFGVYLLVIFTTIVTVAALDWRIILILAALAFLQFLFFRYTVKKDRRNVWDRLPPTWRKINYMLRTTQNFDYAKDIRLFHMKDWLSRKQHDILMEKQERMLYSRNLWIYNSAFAHGIQLLSQACVYGILIYNVVGRDMSIGNFTLYLGLSTTFSDTLRQFLTSMGAYKERSMEVDNFRSFMNLATDDDQDCIPVPKSERYTFEFRDVSYKYEGTDGYALRHLSLTLEAGQKLAIVGLNGAGKTTFIKLLLRLYDVTEGAILLNGVDIRRFRRAEYYRLFAPVFQNVELFAFPMAENVSMKRPDDTDRALSETCLVQAGMQEKLESLTEGVDTQLLKVIHEDGVDLSGGERQKLALARALYKNAPIIVLDEPTAALDALAEYHTLVGHKTAIYISHRLSSCKFCDCIAVFSDGRIKEYGTHDELVQRTNGLYAEMFAAQAQYYH